jgi:hypothetical protein
MSAQMGDRLTVVVQIIVLACLAILGGFMIHQNQTLASTLDQRSAARDQQFNTLLCVAHQIDPTQESIDACFIDNGLEVP